MQSIVRRTIPALVVVAVLAVSAVAAASASAAPEWLLNGTPVTESTAVTFSLASGAKFTLEDKDPLGISNPTLITCSAVAGKGTVAAAGAGTVTEFKLGKCTRTKQGMCKAETKSEEEGKEWVRPMHLSWKTQLHEEQGTENSISAGGAGQVGWEFECTIPPPFNAKVIDRCTIQSEDTEVWSEGTEVHQLFSGFGESINYDCTVGNEALRKGAGEVKTEAVIKGPAGKTLSIKP